MAIQRVSINPEILIWAREQLGLSLEGAADLLGLKAKQLAKWERGDLKPTEKQLYRFAEKLGQAPAVFFLPSRPADEKLPHDFRRLTDSDGGVDPALAKEIRRAQRISVEAQDLLEDMGDERRVFDVTGSLDGDAEEIGSEVRRQLDVTMGIQRSWRRPEVAKKHWIEQIEALGILVLSAERIPISVFRGASITGDGVPVILLNGQDSDAGRTFTMMHELAHLALHNAGICSVFDQLRKSNSANARTEWFCNRVAASVLMPADEVLRDDSVASAGRIDEWPSEKLRPLAQKFCVSQEAMLVRLVELGRATSSYYESRKDDFRKAYEDYRKDRQSKRIPVAYKYRVLNRNGRAYTKLVLNALYDNTITTADVASLTGTNLKHMPAIERELFGRQIVFGHAR